MVESAKELGITLEELNELLDAGKDFLKTHGITREEVYKRIQKKSLYCRFFQDQGEPSIEITIGEARLGMLGGKFLRRVYPDVKPATVVTGYSHNTDGTDLSSHGHPTTKIRPTLPSINDLLLA